MMTSVLATEGLSKQFDGVAVTQDVSLSLRAGEIHALIGPNGAGKTTLISLLSGRLPPAGGRIYLHGYDITRKTLPARVRLGIVQSFQVPKLFGSFSTLANVAIAVQARQSHSFRFVKSASRKPTLINPARQIMKRVGIEHRADMSVKALSHGERRYVELAIALAVQPIVLLADEPLAGLSRGESTQMVDFLTSLKGHYTLLLVEHDMDAVFAIADRISVLVRGRIIATGTPDEIRNNQLVQTAYLGTDEQFPTTSEDRQ